MNITNFIQQEGESLYEAWERFRDVLRKCPHDRLSDWFIVQIFYNGLNFLTKTAIDATTYGGLMDKSFQETQNLIEKMVANNYQ